MPNGYDLDYVSRVQLLASGKSLEINTPHDRSSISFQLNGYLVAKMEYGSNVIEFVPSYHLSGRMMLLMEILWIAGHLGGFRVLVHEGSVECSSR